MILFLSKQENLKAPVSAALLSEKMDIPYRFLKKITRKLIDAGLIVGSRGRYGGLSLNKEPSTISLRDVLEAMDPRGISFNACLSDNDACSRTSGCPVHVQMGKLQNMINGFLSDITFDKLEAELAQG